MEDLIDEKISTDSTTSSKLENDLYDWNIGGKINGELKKIIDAEINASINSPIKKNYTISTKKVVEKVNNDYPQLIDKAYEFKLGRIFYCTYYSILCKDTLVSDSELRKRSLEKLDEFKRETTNALEKKAITNRKESTKNSISIRGNKNNSIIGNNNKQENKTIRTQSNIEKQINTETYNEIENQTNNYIEKSKLKELNFTSSLSIEKCTNKQICISVFIRNLSSFAGTNPKIQIQIYGLKTNLTNHTHPMELQPSQNISKGGEESFKGNYQLFKYKIPTTGMYTSSQSYSENVLYPKDNLHLSLISKPYSSFQEQRYALGKLDCLFKEGRRQTKYYIFDLIHNNKPTIVGEASDKNLDILLKTYDKLINKN